MCVEGIEGSGKSTLLLSIAERLRAHGQRVVTTREPGGTPLGERLRTIFIEPGFVLSPLAEAFVLCAARAQHVIERIEPALAEGAWVLCDRYSAATLAYQGYGRGLPLPMLRTLTAIATGGRAPDLTLLVDVPVTVSRERVRARALMANADADRIEREDAAFHERVRVGYLELARDDASFLTLDGTLVPEALVASAWRALERLLGS